MFKEKGHNICKITSCSLEAVSQYSYLYKVELLYFEYPRDLFKDFEKKKILFEVGKQT